MHFEGTLRTIYTLIEEFFQEIRVFRFPFYQRFYYKPSLKRKPSLAVFHTERNRNIGTNVVLLGNKNELENRVSYEFFGK